MRRWLLAWIKRRWQLVIPAAQSSKQLLPDLLLDTVGAPALLVREQTTRHVPCDVAEVAGFVIVLAHVRRACLSGGGISNPKVLFIGQVTTEPIQVDSADEIAFHETGVNHPIPRS
jgi:hypothetical protein